MLVYISGNQSLVHEGHQYTPNDGEFELDDQWAMRLQAIGVVEIAGGTTETVIRKSINELPVKIQARLCAAGISTDEELQAMTEHELLSLPGIGRKAVDRIMGY